MPSRIRSLTYSIGLPSLLLGLMPWYLLKFSQPWKTSFDLLFTVSGLVLGLGGASLLFSGAYYLMRRGDGTPLPCDPPKRMVVAGPYAHIQHPMLLGFLCMTLGEACWFHSLSLGLYGGVLGVSAHLFVIFGEESRLRERFGEDYEAYQAVTPRWFPCPTSPIC